MASDGKVAEGQTAAGADVPGPLLTELKALVAQGQQIGAIKRYRLMTGADLAKAKDVIDALGRSVTPADALRSVGAGAVRTSLGGVIRLFAAFFWLCAILAGTAAAWQAYDRAVVRNTWPEIDAEVVKCTVVEHRGRQPFSILACQFRYVVHGSEYIAKTGSTGIPSPEQVAAMRDWVAHHRPGERQVIHVDPDDPRNISLGDADAAFQADNLENRLRLAGMFAGGGVLLIAAASWLAARQPRRESAS